MLEVGNREMSHVRTRVTRDGVIQVARVKNFFCCVDLVEAGTGSKDRPDGFCQVPFAHHAADCNGLFPARIDDGPSKLYAATGRGEEHGAPGEAKDRAHLAVFLDDFVVPGIERATDPWTI